MLVQQYLFEGIFASLLGFVLLYGLRGKKKRAGVAGSALVYTLAKPVVSTINTLADALYKVFYASPDQAMKEMQACVHYLSLGGIFSSGPVALLSGLNPRPLSLVGHSFVVAIYGVGRLF